MSNKKVFNPDTALLLDIKRALDGGSVFPAGDLTLQRVKGEWRWDLITGQRFQDDRYVMSGGKHGEHSLSLDSSAERIEAHWAGYQSNSAKKITTRKQLRELADDQGVIKGNGISIKIWPDGTILRNDVRLDLATIMTVKSAVKALGLQ
jgi:DNA gyrase/topoisomerase IV subunit B